MAQGDDTEVVVYDVADFAPHQLTELEERLREAGIPFSWEPSETGPSGARSELVVRLEDEERADVIVEQIEYPEALAPEDDGDDADDGRAYRVMADLYTAADRLKDDLDALALQGDMFDAADAALALDRPPFGVDIDTWITVTTLSRQLVELLEAGDAADGELLQRVARDLRDVLFDLV